MSGEQSCVIIGASHAGVQVALSLRKNGWQGSITLVGDEQPMPYHRPPLSKDFLTGGKSLEQVQLRPAAAFERADVTMRLETRIVGIDRDAKHVSCANGENIPYDKLVLCCGARPRVLPVPGATLPGVCYLRDAADIARIKLRVRSGGNAVVIGGGYIGLEAAATLRKLDMQVTVVEAQDRVLQRVTTPLISEFFTRLHTEQGVSVLCASGVDGIVGESEVQGVALGSGEVIPADLVIVGIGVLPNTELAESAGLEVDNGIRVDQFGRTGDASIYASGDCANGEHEHYGHSMRLESVQNANDQSLTVARSINGDNVAYAALPWFWSDQYDVKLQIAGLTQGFDRQVVRGDASSGRKFAVFYLKGNTLLAVDAINSPKEFVGSKKLILERAQMNAESLADPELALTDCLL